MLGWPGIAGGSRSRMEWEPTMPGMRVRGCLIGRAAPGLLVMMVALAAVPPAAAQDDRSLPPRLAADVEPQEGVCAAKLEIDRFFPEVEGSAGSKGFSLGLAYRGRKAKQDKA